MCNLNAFLFSTKFIYKPCCSTTSLNIFLLNMNFEKFTIKLHFLLPSFIFAKFSNDQSSIVM